MSAAPVLLLLTDETEMARYLKEELIIEGGYPVVHETDVSAAVSVFRKNPFPLIILKLDMPGTVMDDLIRAFREIDQDCIIIGFLNEADPRAMREGLKHGVYDFISKPVNIERLIFLVRKGLELRQIMTSHRQLLNDIQEHNHSLYKQNNILAKRIEESTKNMVRLYEDLRSTYMRTIKVLAHTIEAKDKYTRKHSENVASYAAVIAKEMGLSGEELEKLIEACELHDLGKIGVEDVILSKPASLTPAEWEQIKLHPNTAVEILEPLTFLEDVTKLVKQHHEHYDGTGYPEGRSGDDILLGARIIHLADAYDAMRSARSYRKIPLTKEEAVAEIKKNSGRQFDPKVVEAFLKVVDKVDF